MESNYHNRDFEQFVKQSTDQYRMYPSEKVWRGVHTALHGRRRWYYGVGLALLLLTSGAVTWLMLSSDNREQAILQPISENQTATVSVNKPVKQPDILNPKTVKTNHKINVPFAVTNDLQNDFLMENEAFVSTRITETDNLSQPVTVNIPLATNHNLPIIGREIAINKSISVPVHVQEQASFVKIEDNNPAGANSTNTTTILTASPAAVTENISQEAEKKAEVKETYPLTIESVINSYQRKRKKLTWQAYFTPTISYRRLTENKYFLEANRNTGPGYLYIPDINSAVKHKPDMGLNVGVTAGYPVSRRLKFTAGLQFNISKYDIQASYTYQPEQATVALNTGYWGNSTVTASTNYRNYIGSKENWLRNLYFSASLPIGADFVIKGTNEKPGLGVAATIQPIYLLDNNAYLISTDYKNYVVIPSLINQWNIGASVETYAGYTTGKLRWKIGPQVRYQFGSSFQKTYPVKEHLFDFGLKVGVMLDH
jgi:hypothetical protein